MLDRLSIKTESELEIAMLRSLHLLAEHNQLRSAPAYILIQIGISINTSSLMLLTVGGYNRMANTAISLRKSKSKKAKDVTLLPS